MIVGRSEAGKRIEEAGRAAQNRMEADRISKEIIEHKARYTSVMERFNQLGERLRLELEMMQDAGIGRPGRVHKIIAVVAAQYGFSINDILSERRGKPLVKARHEAIYRAFNETSMSMPAIGRIFGRDHTTIGHAVVIHCERNGLPCPRGIERKYQRSRSIARRAKSDK